MLKRISQYIALTIGLAIIYGCGNGIFHPKNFRDLSPQQRCALIKRQMLYNAYNHNLEAKWLTRTQKQDLENLYQSNNCEKVLASPGQASPV